MKLSGLTDHVNGINFLITDPLIENDSIPSKHKTICFIVTAQ
ncbi:unnamed protein product [Arabidopsis halleri]